MPTSKSNAVWEGKLKDGKGKFAAGSGVFQGPYSFKTRFEGAAEAWRRALDAANVKLDELSFVESHDCFTIAELLEYEAMGLAQPGQGARAVLEGWTAKDGRLPVNPSGGLKAKGHPIGATGVSMHAITAMQLTGQAGAMQLPKADIAGVFNMGGAAVANYVSILEAVR